MLTVVKVTGTVAPGYADYLEGKTATAQAGDYYLKDGERVEAPGRWVTGANAVGADPTARTSGEQLRALMDVRRPDTGAALRPVGATGEAVAALDATFSAPKSVSAVWALADGELRELMERAHETAIDRTISYAVALVPMVRQRVDRQTVIHVPAGDVVATSWRHTTARAVDGPPDPQLHSHVLLHAAVRRDGPVAAIDSRQWLIHRRELGAAYRSELAHELTKLGFAIQRGTGRGGRYFELHGVPAALTDRWSSRHHQVQEAIERRLQQKRTELETVVSRGGDEAVNARARLLQLDASNQLPAGEDRFLAHATRTAKQPVTQEELDHHWTQTAADTGLHRRDIAALRQPARELTPTDENTLAAGLTEHDATLTPTQARAIALEQTAGVPIADALTQLSRMRDGGGLLTLADGALTTREHRRRERATVAVTQRLAAGDVDPIPAELIHEHAARLDAELQEHGGGLSDEQRAALQLACGEGQLVVIEGQAGTGKSTVLTGVARAHEAAGQQIIVTSTAALAAQRLADELTAVGAHPLAHSAAALTHAITSGRLALDPATTIIHDEAALASTRELDRLLDNVEESGARLILVGDPQQSHAVGASGLWPDIEHAAHTHDAHVELTRNLRARDPHDASDQQRFRDGDHHMAVESYAARDRVHLTADQAAAEDAALDAAHQDRQAGQRTLVIAQTSNDHLDELNARAQAIRHQAGELDPASLPVAGRPYRLHAGDEIQLRATIPHPEHGQLRNGTTATITEIDQRTETAILRLSDSREITLTRDQLDQAQARLAYVQHPFPAQGLTSDSTHVIVAEHPTREGSYVALTRARHHTHIYASNENLDPDQAPLPQLAERMSTTEPDLPSIAFPLAHEQSIRDRQDLEATPYHPTLERATEPRATETRALEPPRQSVDAQRSGPVKPRVAAVLGPRPGREGAETDAWDQAAAAIHEYRDRYGIPPDETQTLGVPPPAGAFRQRLDRRYAATRVLDSLATLHLDRDDDELQQRLRDASENTNERSQQTIGRER